MLENQYRTRDDHTNQESAFDYYHGKRKMLVAFNEIYGITNDEMVDLVTYYDEIRCAVDMAKNGYSNKNSTI